MLFALLFAWLPAQAANYNFPNAMPSNCSGSNGTYTCSSSLSFGSSDSITISSPSTITINGNLTLDQTPINAAGSAASMNLIINGTLNPGWNSNVNANVAAASVTKGSGTMRYGGSIETAAGSINLGWNTTVAGSVKTTSGAITLDTASSVGGNVTSTSGSIDIPTGDTIGGDIATSTGKVTLGSKVSAASVTTTYGDISLGGECIISGAIKSTGGKVTTDNAIKAASIATTTGDINLGFQSILSGAITTTEGNVTLNNEVKVQSVSTTSGSVKIDFSSNVYGAITTTTGTITINNGDKTAVGSISTNSGKVELQYRASVCGDITTVSSAVELDQEAKVGGSIRSDSGNITLHYDAHVRGNVTTAGNITLEQLASYNAGSLVLPVCASFPPQSSVASGFNAFEPTLSTTPIPITGFIKTKIAGQSFDLDIVALKNSPAQLNTGFTGSVKVELVKESGQDSCDQRAALASSSIDVTFTADNSGKKKATLPGNLSNNDAWQNVLVRMSYTPSSGSPVIACSTDHFAIRPAYFGVAVTDDNWETAGTNRNLNTVTARGTTFHKAGRPFTITATAYNAIGMVTKKYASSPSTIITGYILPTSCASCSLSNATFVSSGSEGTVVSNTATYNEVGAFKLQLQDASFASIDANDGTTDAERTITSAVVNIGRFVPDHFTLSGVTLTNRSEITPACNPASPFTYMGEPIKSTFTLTAQNATGGTTKNYMGALATLDLNAPSNFNLGALDKAAAGTDLSARVGLISSIGNWPVADSASESTGVASNVTLNYTLNRNPNNTPDGPVISEFGIAPMDADGVMVLPYDMDIVSPAGNDHVSIGQAELVFGRLKLSNAHGSERLNLPIPMRAEYWNGASFVTNQDDSCTRITSANVAVLGYKGGISDANLTSDNVLAAPALFSKGIGSLKLLKPKGNIGKKGSVDVCIDLGSDPAGDLPACAATTSAAMPWLQGKWRGAGYNYDPRSRATFGVFKNANELIYIREMY